MSKIKNCFTSVCRNKKDIKLSIGYRWALFLILQLFIALLVMQPNAWAGLLYLSVNANGDNVFNGKDDGEKLIISFTTSDFGDNPNELGEGGQQYTYKILVDYLGDKMIAIGPGDGNVLSKNQTVQFVWDGMYFKKGDEGDREKLQDGDYTIKVALTSVGTPLPFGQTAELTTQVTVDTKVPEVTISIDDDAFSPDLYSLPVYYDIDEDVSEAWLEFQRAPGNANIGRRVALSTTSGSHTYNWNGEDNSRRAFFDGQYTLRIRVKDKGGNEAESGKTGNITIDTEEPRITSITLNDSIALTNGKFVNEPITTINFTADDPDGTGINLTGRDTEVLIRPVGGKNLRGVMTFGNKATFTLGDALDVLEENGEYEVTAFISDNVGNLASNRVRFTFDNSTPILKSVATHSGEFTAGSGISGLTNYVEATLDDNIELNLADSTIRLKGPSGSDVLGQQIRPTDDTIRWQLLSPLSVKDGIHDGQYTVEVVASDKAGNKTTSIQITFLFDNLAPELVSVNPTRDGDPFNILGDTVYYNLPLNQFVATFDDGEFGTGVIFSGADDISRILFGTPKVDGGVDAISGRAFPDLNNNVLTYILDDPLLNSDGSQDGSYRLNVKAADPLGNNKIYSFHLIYDTQVPTLASTVPAANQSVQDLSQVVVKLNETTSGIDFVQSVFALKRNMGENQVEVPVNISSNGTDTATLTLLQPIALDGSDDGSYIIEVTPADRAGNIGAVVRREFYLVNQARPQVKLITPETGTVNSLGDITVELVGYIGSGINFDASTITVRNAQGQIVPQAEVVADAATNQLTWSTEAAIPKGTADGRYTISASFRDYSGVVISQTFNLNLDTQFPTITSVQVGTEALTQLSLDSTIDVTESFSHISIEFDATDSDFENTVVTLTDPDGNEIASRKSIDGEALLTLSFQNLAKLGSYTLTVTPIDNIGNISESPFIYKFNLDIAVPVVTSILIGGQSGAIVYVRGNAGEIVATIADTTGIGIAAGQGESNIIVTSDSGLPVPGITTINSENQLIWRPSVLPSDGSADGRYTVSVTPVDKAGRTGDVAYRAFIFDTQSPHITAAAPITLHQPISYVGDSLEQFQFSVEDVGPALLDLDDQTISFTKKSGEVVAGHITHDNTNQLFFTLPAPLPTDGSADGEYTLTVNLVDKAGNPYQVQHTVVYDSQAPQLASVSLNTETPLNLTPYQVTDLSGSISKITLNFIEMTRIDFDNTIITLLGPDGSTIPLTLKNNGIGEITANFVSLIKGDLYTLSVTPQDIVGNVAQGAVPYLFRLKFEVPGITTVHANSVSASYELASYEILDISDAINSFSLNFTDAERIDFENTGVTLTSPNGQDIAVTQEESGSNQFLVRFVPLTQSGLYTLSVTPQDIAGNVAQSQTQYQFRLEITLPTVGSVLIDGQLDTNILINDPDTEIVATFADATGVGLAFGDSGSTITVNSEQGFAVSGIITSNGTNQVTWTPAALPTDGSADGRYTVTITPVDKSGRSGTVVNRHFIYDTQAPRITNATPIILHQPMSYIGANLTSIELTVEDVGPSLLDLDDQTIGLKNEEGEMVSGHVTNDGINRIFFTLSTPLSTDGSADGKYILTIGLVDKAGNPNEVEHNIFYDSQVPRLSSVSLNTETPIDLTAYQVTDLSESINKLTLNFVETTQVNFAATVITLIGPGNSSIPLTIENNGVDQLTASFVTLTQGGLYTLSVTPQDIAGNVAQSPIQYQFRLEITLPTVGSVLIDGQLGTNILINVPDTEIVATFLDATGVGLAFGNSGSTITVNSEQGFAVSGIITSNGTNQVTWTPAALPTDGSADGRYTVTITPVDKSGRSGTVVNRHFIYDTQAPRITNATPIILHQPMSYIGANLTSIELTVEDVGPSLLDLDDQTIGLTNEEGEMVSGHVTNDGINRIFFTLSTPLSTDGSADGKYILMISLVDKAGNPNEVEHNIFYDSQVPRLSSVSLNTETPIDLTAYQVTDLSESINKLTINFVETTQVNFAATVITLIGPGNSSIPLTIENNGVDQLTASFVTLTQGGLYTLSVTPQDIAGNVAQSLIQYQFRLEITLPTVGSVLIDGQLGTNILINDPDTEIVATFLDATGVGLAFGNSGSTITVNSEQGFAVSGIITSNGTNQVTWTPAALPTDGSADGRYTVTITPVDKSGRSGTVVNRHFIYDTQAPRITNATPIILHQPMSYIGANLTSIELTVEDVGPSLLDLDDQTIGLTNEEGEMVSGHVTNDGINRIFFTLSTPLSTDGSADGKYILTIGLVDKAGNPNEVEHNIFYDSQVPRLSSVSLNTETPIDLTAYQVTDLSESINKLTINFVETTQVNFAATVITLIGPGNSSIPLTIENNGVDQLTASFVTLTQGGLYTLSVTPQDIAGNVAQGTVSYPFRLKFEIPGLASVTANSADVSLQLIQHEIVETSELINSLTLEFTDPLRIDFENTNISLRGPDGQEILVTLEDNDSSQLIVRFIPLEQSGLYTLSVTPQDNAGNIAQNAVSYQFGLEFDMPEIASVKANTADTSLDLSPYEIAEFSEPVEGFTLEFTNGSRVDFENTSVVLTGPNGQQIPITLEDDDDTTLFVKFVALEQSGLYTLSITLQDIEGAVAQNAVSYQLRLEFDMPEIASVKANTADTSLDLTPYEIAELSEPVGGFTLEFTNGSRVDFENTSVVLTGPNGQQIPIILEDDDDTTLFVKFVALEQSGLYTLSITPQDIDGTVAQNAVSYQLRLEFDMPEIASVKANTADTSLDLSPYEIAELSEPVEGFTLEFTNESRVDFENTSVVLTGPNGQQIPITLEDDDDTTLFVKFVALEQSGLYTLSITPQDIDGTVAQNAVSYQLRLKFEVPGLESVIAHTNDISIALIQHEIVEISESIGSLTLKFTDPQRVDFENTQVTLSDANGQQIPVTLENDENTQLTVRFVPLTQSGIYTISVTPQDIAGNVAQTDILYQFRLDTTLPSVSSVLIDGKVGSAVFVRTSVPRIIANITDSIGVGVSLGDNGSTIVVTNSEGIQLSGTTTLDAANQLTWTPIPLPVDGSADGQYTVIITPVDKVGRTGTAVRRQFIYDTQAPRITSASPITLHAPISYLGSGLNQFVLTVEDVGPADMVFASQVVVLMDVTRKPIPAKLTYDELTNQLYLTLDTPFASDGTADGPYTLNVLLTDKAGNSLNTRFNLVYDSIIPQVTSVQANTAGTPVELTLNQVAELSESVDTITIRFNEATRVDFENTIVSLFDPDFLTVPLTIGDDGVSQMTLSFVALTQIGQYTLSVTPQDIAGNTAQSAMQYNFNLEFILPDVESVIIGDTITLGSGDTVYVNADNLVIAANLLDPAGTGLSFDPITGSEIIVATLDGIIVPGSVATNGTDLLVWRPKTLSNDGSSDGRYAVYVYAVDKKGREAGAVYREFVYDTQEPEITNATPMDLSQPVSYISESLTQFQFTIQDVGPADLMLEDQLVTLRNQNGALVPTKLTNDTNNQLFLTLDESLPLDGSRDGQYTVEITFSDRSGNVLSINHPIVYDTQAPTLVSTVPADSELLTEDVSQIQVNLDDKGESGIDWSRTTVTLIDPDGTVISGDLSSDGKSQLTLRTNHLVADGRYVIQVQAIDRAGNGSRSVHESDFLLSRRLPAIVSTVPITAPRDEAYTNETVEEVELLLETVDARHLSTVRLLNAEGQVIAGQQHRETGKLIYRLVRPLATDGSEDGDYTIEFTPISSSGRSSAAQSLVFTYDTQSPELDPKDVHLIVAEQQVDNSLVRIRLDITDNQAGVDWQNLDTEWVTFERISPNSTDIDGSVLYVSEEPEHLLFTLNVPLADDGSADGKYRISVTPIDKAGNGDETYEKEFTYDTSPPIIDPNSLLLNEAPLLTDIDADDYPSAVSTSGGVVIQAVVSDTGLGVNLSQSSIVVRNPNGQEITGTTRQNGVDTLVFKSDGLNIEGVYQVTVTATGNDTELLGITPQGSITTAFLYETTEPTAVVTDDGGRTELTDEALPLVGTAADPEGIRRTGQQGENEIPIPASGVWLVEIVGTGPDGQPIEPVPAADDSDAQQEPWSRWKVDFLPTRSGDYDLDIRVTDKAGNYAVYDYGEVTMSVSFTFSGNTFVWPNPLRQSNDDVGFLSFDLNTSDDTVKLNLYIYDWSGDMVYSKTYDRIIPEHRNGNEVSWQLKNNAGNRVARGIYVFRLEAVDGAGNRANAVGKILVVD